MLFTCNNGSWKNFKVWDNKNAYFSWNGSEYDLVFDASFWEHSCSIQSFMDKITQQYVSEIIAVESQIVGFEPIKYVSNLDGSKTLTLQRWKN